MAGAKIPMGMGKLGFNNAIFKRKFRWTFEVFDICGNKTVPADYVKVASRPNLDIEETEINHLNAKRFLPGKGTWQEMSVTYYDVASVDNAALYSWLASVYDFTDPIGLHQGSRTSDYAGNALLQLYDGCGVALEAWVLFDIWPKAINFGELDYSSSEEVTIETTLRYQSAKYYPLCPKFPITSCCTPCGAGGGNQPGTVGGFLNGGGGNNNVGTIIV